MLPCFNFGLSLLILSAPGQRWNPVDGFSDRLLPSDRWQWSDATGLNHQPLSGFQLPSENWEWEAEWHQDENFGGEPTEKGVSIDFTDFTYASPYAMGHHLCCLQGWTYAIDFPAMYTKDKKWNSCVRRCRWIRYRRYKSQDAWVKVGTCTNVSLSGNCVVSVFCTCW